MDIDEVYIDWHIQNMQWNCHASNYMKIVCFSMAVLFWHKSHITCPSEKMKISKHEDGNFKEDAVNDTVDDTCFGVCFCGCHFQSFI